MKRAKVFQLDTLAGWLEELEGGMWRFRYADDYSGLPVSLSMPVRTEPYEFLGKFPPAFEGLLPEGAQLEALLRVSKLDSKDYFAQLMSVGKDVVGSLTFQQI